MTIKLITAGHRGCIGVSVVSSRPPARARALAGSEQLDRGEGAAEPELGVFLACNGRNARHGCLGKSVNIFPVLLALVVTFSRDAPNTKFNSLEIKKKKKIPPKRNSEALL